VLHRAAVGPGMVLFLGLIGLAGWQAFVKLYATDALETDIAGAIFLLYGVLILAIRVIGARLPDVLGPVRAGTGALVFGAAGLVVIAAFESVAGLVVGTIVFALGMSLMYPSLLLLALSRAPDRERAAVVGTFSTFFDLSQGVGGVATGSAEHVAGFRGAFGIGALTAIGGLFVLRRTTRD
jgi:predicted MFS family arabinose efflux permease